MGTVVYYLAPALVMAAIGLVVALAQMLILRRRRLHGESVVPEGLEGHHCGACLFAKEQRALQEDEDEDEGRPPPCPAARD